MLLLKDILPESSWHWKAVVGYPGFPRRVAFSNLLQGTGIQMILEHTGLMLLSFPRPFGFFPFDGVTDIFAGLRKPNLNVQSHRRRLYLHSHYLIGTVLRCNLSSQFRLAPLIANYSHSFLFLFFLPHMKRTFYLAPFPADSALLWNFSFVNSASEADLGNNPKKGSLSSRWCWKFILIYIFILWPAFAQRYSPKIQQGL